MPAFGIIRPWACFAGEVRLWTKPDPDPGELGSLWEVGDQGLSAWPARVTS